MRRRLGVLVGATAVVVLMALPEAWARNETLPTIDLQARCHKSERSVIDMMGDPSLRGRAFDLCIKSEQEARDALLKAWGEIPQAYKAFCIRPGDYSASYVEWIACLEMKIDLRKQRETASPTVNSPPTRCPVIEYTADGDIKSIRPCALQR